MSEQSRSPVNSAMWGRGQYFLVAWSVGLILLQAIVAWLAIVPVHDSAKATAVRHAARLSSNGADPGATPPDLELPKGANPTHVNAGIYVDRIVDLSIKDASWTVDFYLWFRWRGDGVEPGNGFQVVDGSIDSQQR